MNESIGAVQTVSSQAMKLMEASDTLIAQANKIEGTLFRRSPEPGEPNRPKCGPECLQEALEMIERNIHVASVTLANIIEWL